MNKYERASQHHFVTSIGTEWVYHWSASIPSNSAMYYHIVLFSLALSLSSAHIHTHAPFIHFHSEWAKHFPVVWKVFGWILCRNISLDGKKRDLHELRFRFSLYNFASIVECECVCVCECKPSSTERVLLCLFAINSLQIFCSRKRHRCHTKLWQSCCRNAIVATAGAAVSSWNSHCVYDFLVVQSFAFKLLLATVFAFLIPSVCQNAHHVYVLFSVLFLFWIEIIFIRRWFSHQLANVNYQYKIMLTRNPHRVGERERHRGANWGKENGWKFEREK